MICSNIVHPASNIQRPLSNFHYPASTLLLSVAAMSLFTAGLGGLANRLAKRNPQWGHRFGLACCTLTIFIGGFWLFAG